MDHSSRFHSGRRGSALTIRVIPQSEYNKLIKIDEDGTLQICIKSPLASGHANDDLIGTLEKGLSVSKIQFEIIAGENSAEKIVAIMDVDPDEIQERIMKWYGNPN